MSTERTILRHPPNNSTTTPPRPESVRPGPTLLVTAGPTLEPIDAVRFIGNRSSGRLGVALADEAARRGWKVTLLLGPVCVRAGEPGVRVRSFRTCADLQGLLAEEAPGADVLIMAAAVADFRPRPHPAMSGGKFRRQGEGIVLELEATPDLLAGVAAARRPGQVLVGFALEPRADMLISGRAKLERKGVDLVVANPLETMDSEGIEGVALGPDGFEARPPEPGAIAKASFAGWLLDVVSERMSRGAGNE